MMEHLKQEVEQHGFASDNVIFRGNKCRITWLREKERSQAVTDVIRIEPVSLDLDVVKDIVKELTTIDSELFIKKSFKNWTFRLTHFLNTTEDRVELGLSDKANLLLGFLRENKVSVKEYDEVRFVISRKSWE